MKRYFSIGVMLILFSFGHVAKASEEINLISNPSFEQAASYSLPTNWTHRKIGNNVSAFSYLRTGYEGGRSVSIKVSQYAGGESYWVPAAVPVVASSTYLYAEYYKATMNTKLYALVTRVDGSQLTIPLRDLLPAATWTKVSVPITVPGTAKTLTVIHSATGLGTLTLDAVSLSASSSIVVVSPPATTTPTTTPTSTSSNLMINPSLELPSSVATLPLYWKTFKTGTNNAKFTYLTTGHTGSRSIKVSSTLYTNGLAYYKSPVVPVNGDTTYALSFYQKSDTYAEVDAEITLENGEVVYQYLGVTYPSTNWTQFSTRITMPAGAKSVSVYTILYSVGSVTTDDYALTPVVTVPLERPMVSLTFDDFFTSMHDVVLPSFQSRNLAGTIYISTKDLGTSGTMSGAQLQEMVNAGFEIGSHTVTHPHMPLLSTSQAAYELTQSKADIAAFAGVETKSFATPYGEYTDDLKAQIAQSYTSHRSVDVGYNTKDNFDAFNIKAMSTTNQTTPETVLGWVDEAIKNKAWLVLVYHDITNNGGTWTNTPAHLQTVLDGLQSKRVTVKTVSEALTEVLPQITK